LGLHFDSDLDGWRRRLLGQVLQCARVLERQTLDVLRIDDQLLSLGAGGRLGLRVADDFIRHVSPRSSAEPRAIARLTRITLLSQRPRRNLHPRPAIPGALRTPLAP